MHLNAFSMAGDARAISDCVTRTIEFCHAILTFYLGVVPPSRDTLLGPET
jgi:hypothetical protein